MKKSMIFVLALILVLILVFIIGYATEWKLGLLYAVSTIIGGIIGSLYAVYEHNNNNVR